MVMVTVDLILDRPCASNWPGLFAGDDGDDSLMNVVFRALENTRIVRSSRLVRHQPGSLSEAWLHHRA